MNNGRRIGAFVVAAAAAMAMATVGVASPAAAMERGPQPVSNWLRPVRANTSTSVNIGWRTDRRICDVEVRVDGGRRVEVGYPGFRNYTSFWRGDSLRAGWTDYTAIRVNPHYDRAGTAVLRATIQYDNCGPHSRMQYKSSLLTLPVLRNNDWPGNGGPGGPGDDGPGWPGNGGPGNGGPGGPGNGGHGGPGNGGPGGPGNGGPGGPGNGGPGGPGNGGPGGPGNH